MSIDKSRQDHALSLKERGLSVAVFTVCHNPLMGLGLKKLLSNTHFTVHEGTFAVSSDLPDIAQEEFALFFVDGNNRPEGAAHVIRDLKTRFPTGKIVILADQFEADTVTAVWSAGATGFFLSSIGQEVLIRSLDLVMLGETVLPASLVLSTMDEMMAQADRRFSADTGSSEYSDSKGRKLSTREAEILLWMKEGAPNKVIARKLKLSEATVKVHVKAILKKIGVLNRTQAALWAAQNMPAEPGTHQVEAA